MYIYIYIYMYTYIYMYIHMYIYIYILYILDDEGALAGALNTRTRAPLPGGEASRNLNLSLQNVRFQRGAPPPPTAVVVSGVVVAAAAARRGEEEASGTQFTCFTGTQVQILTRLAVLSSLLFPSLIFTFSSLL